MFFFDVFIQRNNIQCKRYNIRIEKIHLKICEFYSQFHQFGFLNYSEMEKEMYFYNFSSFKYTAAHGIVKWNVFLPPTPPSSLLGNPTLTL
jgi:Na+-transporting NADH:ubiquinone oxidoreductase subunit NqrF